MGATGTSQVAQSSLLRPCTSIKAKQTPKERHLTNGRYRDQPGSSIFLTETMHVDQGQTNAEEETLNQWTLLGLASTSDHDLDQTTPKAIHSYLYTKFHPQVIMTEVKDMMRVEFSMHYKLTGREKHVALAGDISQLGSWQSDKALVAKHGGIDGMNRHSICIEVPRRSHINFKWLILDQNMQPIRWEECENKHLHIFYEVGESLSVYNPWDRPPEIIGVHYGPEASSSIPEAVRLRQKESAEKVIKEAKAHWKKQMDLWDATQSTGSMAQLQDSPKDDIASTTQDNDTSVHYGPEASSSIAEAVRLRQKESAEKVIKEAKAHWKKQMDLWDATQSTGSMAQLQDSPKDDIASTTQDNDTSERQYTPSYLATATVNLLNTGAGSFSSSLGWLKENATNIKNMTTTANMLQTGSACKHAPDRI
ncbi:uncharacterized protein LOC128205760 [Mya arenaria]|nr:uncharacterized protein LOC128205760 [Mya arenaria]